MMEFCFGIIPVRKAKLGWQVFLVKHKKGNYWSFPKGHHKADEKRLQTTQRELFEETGFQVSQFLPISPFPPVEELTERYSFKRNGEIIDKTVTYFVAEVTGEFTPQKDEIEEGNWFYLTFLSRKNNFGFSKQID
jgi:bis(5'-nucleosidyl)-tetraphosphatase